MFIHQHLDSGSFGSLTLTFTRRLLQVLSNFMIVTPFVSCWTVFTFLGLVLQGFLLMTPAYWRYSTPCPDLCALATTSLWLLIYWHFWMYKLVIMYFIEIFSKIFVSFENKFLSQLWEDIFYRLPYVHFPLHEWLSLWTSELPAKGMPILPLVYNSFSPTRVMKVMIKAQIFSCITWFIAVFIPYNTFEGNWIVYYSNCPVLRKK